MTTKPASIPKEKVPSIWQILVVMLAVVALPTTILIAWFPSVVSDLKDQIEVASLAASEASSDSKASKVASEATLERLDGLIYAIALQDASPSAPEKYALFAEITPSDFYNRLLESKKWGDFRYSSFSGKDWVFVTRAAYSELTAAEQTILQGSFDRGGVRFSVERILPSIETWPVQYKRPIFIESVSDALKSRGIEGLFMTYDE